MKIDEFRDSETPSVKSLLVLLSVSLAIIVGAIVSLSFHLNELPSYCSMLWMLLFFAFLFIASVGSILWHWEQCSKAPDEPLKCTWRSIDKAAVAENEFCYVVTLCVSDGSAMATQVVMPNIVSFMESEEHAGTLIVRPPHDGEEAHCDVYIETPSITFPIYNKNIGGNNQ